MKRFLLCVSIAAVAASAFAETKYYASDPLEVYGLMKGISGNGKYAVVTDIDDNVAYLWSIENPDEFTVIEPNSANKGAMLYGVADDGTAVGSLFSGTQYRAAIYKDGEWDVLATHPEVMNEQYAVAITPDARVIAGFEFDRDANAEQGGRYFPVVWELDENGEYDITKFNDLQLPAHQGFITECLSPDGKYIGGRLYCAAMAEIPAIIDVENHEITYWNELEVRYEPFMYKGKYLYYDEDGNQKWTEDIDDPRLALWDEYYIDGFHDTDSSNTFIGELLSCDENGNFYGYRTVAHNVSEDGETADLVNYASIYNVNTKEWTDMAGHTAFSLGYNNGTTMFAANATMVTISESGEENVVSIFDGLGFSAADDISAITHGSSDGKVLGGIYGIYNAAAQAPDYHPFIIILDEGIAGITEIAIDNGSNIAIVTSRGHIEVAGAKTVAVYDLSGKLVSTASSCNVAPGMYVVNADNVSRKVIVK